MVLEKFELRSGTGGRGQYKGGEGVERRIRFRKKQTLCCLTERRATRPYGLAGTETFFLI